MCSNNIYIARLRSVCFWVLKTAYFPRELRMFFSLFESGVLGSLNSTGTYLWKVFLITRVKFLRMKQFVQYHCQSRSNANTSNSDPTSAILKEMSTKLFLWMEWNETFRTRRDPFAPRNFRTSARKIWLNGLRPVSLSTRGTWFSVSFSHEPPCCLFFKDCHPLLYTG